MNPARLAELHRQRAALQRQIAEVDARIAEAVIEEPEPRAKRPAYVVPGEATDADRARAEKQLRRRGYDVRPRPARRGQDGAQ